MPAPNSPAKIHILNKTGIYGVRRLYGFLSVMQQKVKITKRRQRAFKIKGLTWIVERSFAWLGRNRRRSKNYEYMVQTSQTTIDIAAIPITLNRLVPA